MLHLSVTTTIFLRKVGVLIFICNKMRHKQQRNASAKQKAPQQPLEKNKERGYGAVASLRYAISSFRSAGFLIPANTILVPLMYFFGASR